MVKGSQTRSPETSEARHKPTRPRNWLPLLLALLAALVLIATVAVAAQRHDTAPNGHDHMNQNMEKDTAEPKSEEHTGYEEPPAE